MIESKSVKLETDHTMIVPITVSVLCRGRGFIKLATYDDSTLVSYQQEDRTS